MAAQPVTQTDGPMMVRTRFMKYVFDLIERGEIAPTRGTTEATGKSAGSTTTTTAVVVPRRELTTQTESGTRVVMDVNTDHYALLKEFMRHFYADVAISWPSVGEMSAGESVKFKEDVCKLARDLGKKQAKITSVDMITAKTKEIGMPVARNTIGTGMLIKVLLADPGDYPDKVKKPEEFEKKDGMMEYIKSDDMVEKEDVWRLVQPVFSKDRPIEKNGSRKRNTAVTMNSHYFYVVVPKKEPTLETIKKGPLIDKSAIDKTYARQDSTQYQQYPGAFYGVHEGKEGGEEIEEEEMDEESEDGGGGGGARGVKKMPDTSFESDIDRVNNVIYYNTTRKYAEPPNELRNFLVEKYIVLTVKAAEEIIPPDTNQNRKYSTGQREDFKLGNWREYVIHALIHACTIGATYGDVVGMLKTPKPVR